MVMTTMTFARVMMLMHIAAAIMMLRKSETLDMRDAARPKPISYALKSLSLILGLEE